MREAWPAVWGDEKRWTWGALAFAMALAAAVILWLGRGMTFWGDELSLMLISPHFGIGDALQPHEGHLVLVTRIVYKAMFETFGTAYLPFRLLTVATILLTVGLLFTYMAKRVGHLVALAPCLVLLFFGSDSLHVLLGNGFGVLFGVACAVGALLLLERDDRRGDVGACLLLCVAVATYSVALAFVVGAGAGILLRRDRLQRVWIVAVPIALYAAWWLWSQGLDTASGGQASPTNALLLPAWGFQSLSAVLEALSGFGYEFSQSAPAPSIGPALAVAGLAALGWRLARGPIPRPLLAALATLLALWLLGALVSDSQMGRVPDDPRYLFPGSVVVLLVAAEAAAGLRWSRAALVLLYVFAAGGLAVNAAELRDRSAELREINAVQTRAALTALEVAGSHTAPDFVPPPPPGIELPLLGAQSPLAVPFTSLPDGESASRALLSARRSYGRLGFTVADLRAHGEPATAGADAVLVGALRLGLASPGGPVRTGACTTAPAEPGSGAVARLPRGGALLRAPAATEVRVRRFGTKTTFGIGTLAPHRAAILRIPVDRVAVPWWAYAPSASLTVCPLR